MSSEPVVALGQRPQHRLDRQVVRGVVGEHHLQRAGVVDPQERLDRLDDGGRLVRQVGGDDGAGRRVVERRRPAPAGTAAGGTGRAPAAPRRRSTSPVTSSATTTTQVRRSGRRTKPARSVVQYSRNGSTIPMTKVTQDLQRGPGAQPLDGRRPAGLRGAGRAAPLGQPASSPARSATGWRSRCTAAWSTAPGGVLQAPRRRCRRPRAPVQPDSGVTLTRSPATVSGARASCLGQAPAAVRCTAAGVRLRQQQGEADRPRVRPAVSRASPAAASTSPSRRCSSSTPRSPKRCRTLSVSCTLEDGDEAPTAAAGGALALALELVEERAGRWPGRCAGRCAAGPPAPAGGSTWRRPARPARPSWNGLVM